MLKNKIAIQAACFAVFAFGISSLFSSAEACKKDPSNCSVEVKKGEITFKDSKPGGGKCGIQIEKDNGTEEYYIKCE